jgi:glucose-6-phosphate isomerase
MNMKQSLLDLFENNPNRFQELSWNNEFLWADFSKNHISSLGQFNEVETERLNRYRNQLFDGSMINDSENRAAMHFRLRRTIPIDSTDYQVIEVRNKFLEFAEIVHTGKLLGYNNQIIDHIVNIGIGGSDLGPRFLSDALKDFNQNNLRISFVSNIDQKSILDTLAITDPNKVLFVVCSKTFTTQETLQNALNAKKWLIEHLGEKAVNYHFCAVSTNISEAIQFGINEQRIFGFWDWVGGRYSLWSAIGLSLACFIGKKHFEQLLLGAEKADQHFQNTDWNKNLPAILAQIDHYYFRSQNYSSKLVVPYAHRLSSLVSFIQQLVMESNGKSIDKNGKNTERTGMVWWGTSGTDAQHSYFQLLHQGTEKIHTEFIGVIHQSNCEPDHQNKLLSNLLAQSRALMIGHENTNVPVKHFPGNKPSTTILLNEVSPESLGFLIATFEHRVLCEAALLNINPFDQFGVELGKQLCNELLPLLENKSESTTLDSSTSGLLKVIAERG